MKHNYPFTAIVGQEQMKLALILNLINPALGGVLMFFEIPLFFAPSFYEMDLSEIPVLICTFYLGPVAGVVYVPATATLYFGAEGLGAYRLADYRDEATPAWAELTDAGRRLPLAEGRTDYVVVVSRSHLSAETEAFIDEARRAHADVRTVPSGSSIKICLVAEGTADVYPRLAPTMEWDTAAGHAVVRAAGGDIVEAGNGATLRYNKRDLTNPYFIVRRDANAPQS